MPKHGEKIAPEGVNKDYKCGLYANGSGSCLCAYCCYHCKQKAICANSCKNSPVLCGKQIFERSGTDGNDKI